MSTMQINSYDNKVFSAYGHFVGDNAPSILMVQEIFGINDAMRQTADSWAGQGFNVICPDLYWRHTPNIELNPRDEHDFKQGLAIRATLDPEAVMKDLISARDHMLARTEHSKIAAVGYCWGGNLVVKLATQSQVTCAVSYYGVGLGQLLSQTDQVAPSLMHIAALDKFVNVEVQQAIHAQVERLTMNNQTVQAYVYDGVDHGFARPQGEHWDSQAKELAQNRSLAFMKQCLES